MSSKNLSYTISKTNKGFDLEKAIPSAIVKNANEFIHPPIKNLGYKGILKTSTEIKRWFKNSKDIEKEFTLTATLMERGGTGGAIFRNLYRDFLKEAYEITNLEKIKKAHELFTIIATQWTEVSSLLHQAGKTKDIAFINRAAGILVDLSAREKSTMEILATLPH